MSAGSVDEKADIYALGVMLYEMLTGVLPFLADGIGQIMLMHLQEAPRPVRDLAPEVPEDLADLALRLLGKKAAERPSAREVVRILDGTTSLSDAAKARALISALPGIPPGIPAGPPPAALPSAPGVPPVSPLPPPQRLPSNAATAIAVEIPPAPDAVPLAAGSVRSRAAAQATFVQRGTSATTVENWTYIDHPLANNLPDAQIHFTHNWNPGGQGGTYNNHNTGVWYAGNGRWAVYNEDRITMAPTCAFNVHITRAGFVHRATPGNIINNWTLIDHPSTNGKKDALVLVSPNWNPGAQGGQYNNHAIGVWYTNGRWSIYNQDRAPMPPNAAWNVLVLEQAFCHRVTPENLIGSNGTWLSSPAARGNPDAIVLVTPNWNPGGLGGVYHDHPIGVYYCVDRWAIFNQDMAPMPLGAAFNVWIA